MTISLLNLTKWLYDWKQKSQENIKKTSMLNLNSREREISVVHTTTGVLIVRRKKKTSTVCIQKRRKQVLRVLQENGKTIE